MDYKKMMGYKKTKKVVKKQPKPKVNKVIESIKKEFNIKEVGASQVYKKHTKLIEKNMENLTDSVRELTNFLMKQGAKGEAREVGSIYATSIGRFHKFLTTKFVQMLRKLI